MIFPVENGRAFGHQQGMLMCFCVFAIYRSSISYRDMQTSRGAIIKLMLFAQMLLKACTLGFF